MKPALPPNIFDRYIASCAEQVRLAMRLKCDPAIAEDARGYVLELTENSIADVYSAHFGVQPDVARSVALHLVTRMVDAANEQPARSFLLN